MINVNDSPGATFTTHFGSYTSSAGTVVVVTGTAVVGADVELPPGVVVDEPGTVDAVLVEEPGPVVLVAVPVAGTSVVLDPDVGVEGGPGSVVDVVTTVVVVDEAAVVTAGPWPPEPPSEPLHAAMSNTHEESNSPPDRLRIGVTVVSPTARVASPRAPATQLSRLPTRQPGADRSAGLPSVTA